MRVFLFAILFLPACLFAQNTISVQVNNVRSSNGRISVAVYDSDETFLSFEGVIKTGTVQANKGKVTLELEDLPVGEYALAVFHDENANGELDTNWLGIPKEKVAFSKAKMRTFGPPKYQDCAFKVTSDYEIIIDL